MASNSFDGGEYVPNTTSGVMTGSPGVLQALGYGQGQVVLNPKFEALLSKMREMHNKKSQDYANNKNRYQNFESTAVSAGTDVGTVFRTLIGVKLARLSELQGNGKTPQNESVQDSLLDLAVYAALYASYYMEAK